MRQCAGEATPNLLEQGLSLLDRGGSLLQPSGVDHRLHRNQVEKNFNLSDPKRSGVSIVYQERNKI